MVSEILQTGDIFPNKASREVESNTMEKVRKSKNAKHRQSQQHIQAQHILKDIHIFIKTWSEEKRGREVGLKRGATCRNISNKSTQSKTRGGREIEKEINKKGGWWKEKGGQ